MSAGRFSWIVAIVRAGPHGPLVSSRTIIAASRRRNDDR